MNSTLGDRLLLARRQSGLNQETLADQASINRTYISSLERGIADNPTKEIIEALAGALGVRPEYLAGWTDDPLGEDLPPSIAEGRIVYQVNSREQYRLTQELLDLFGELTPENQRLALQIIEQFRKAQNVRIIGGE